MNRASYNARFGTLTLDTIAKLFPSLASSAIYAGAVWLFFSKVDEKLPSLRGPILDWITRKDRTLPWGHLYVSLICAGVGEQIWSRRRLTFAVLTVLSTLLIPLILGQQLFATLGELLGPPVSLSVYFSIKLYLHSLSDIFRPLALTPQWILYSWRSIIALVISVMISASCISVFIYIVRRRGEKLSLWFSILAYGIYLAVTCAVAYLAITFIETYIYALHPMMPNSLWRDWYLVTHYDADPDFCQKIREAWEEAEECHAAIEMMRLTLYEHVGYLLMIVTPAIIVLILPSLFLLVIVFARLITWFGIAIDFYARIGDQEALLKTPLRFIGDIASVGVFVVLACISLFK